MDNRRAERVATDDAVLFVAGGRKCRGILRNLSIGGCMITASQCAVNVGDPFSVTLLEGLTIEGEVVWAQGDDIGVRFFKPLAEAALRFFQLGDQDADLAEEPTDSFGRPLPPLSREERRRGPSRTR